jgi:hypothetical protein
MSAPELSSERSWYIAERWQEFAGEARANVLRIGAVGAFYSVHLLEHFGYLQINRPEAAVGDVVAANFHGSVTALAVAWTMTAVAVLLCLQQRIFPAWLKYVSTAADIAFLTAILCIANGPRSALIMAYPLVIVLAGLRFSLPLVRFATVGSLLGYIVVLGCAKWPERFGRGNIDMQVPRYQQLMTLLAIALVGILLGQILRRVRVLAEDFRQRSAAQAAQESSGGA